MLAGACAPVRIGRICVVREAGAGALGGRGFLAIPPGTPPTATGAVIE